jgi:hypothetical protein
MAVEAIPSTPSCIMGPSSVKNPPITPNMMGTSIMATSADSRFDIIKYMNTAIIENPKMDNIFKPPSVYHHLILIALSLETIIH